MIEACATYNKANIEFVYTSLYETENPMLSACRYGAITEKRVFEKSNEHGNITVRVDERKTRNALNLVEFDARCPKTGTMFNNGQWIYWIAQIAQAIADDTAKGIEISKADRQQLAQEYKDAKAASTFVCLTSKNILEKDIQSVVDAILFMPKENEADKNSLVVTCKNVNSLLAHRSKAGKEALSTRCMNSREALIAVENIMDSLTTGTPYTIDMKAKK